MTDEQKDKIQGDIYLLISETTFQAVARKAMFNEWIPDGVRYWLEGPTPTGYYFLLTSVAKEGKREKKTAGVLIPTRLNKKVVADDLRGAFGADVVLWKEENKAA